MVVEGEDSRDLAALRAATGSETRSYTSCGNHSPVTSVTMNLCSFPGSISMTGSFYEEMED
jgi:hypothetical protein